MVLSRGSFYTLVLSALLLLLFPAPSSGSRYSPEGLYEVEHKTLKNGLKLIMSQREGVHNVAFRLVVGVGTMSFPRGKRETPHFLEHLLFSGTDKHSEEELEKLVQSKGGRWNASTGKYETRIELDIYSGNLSFAVDLLHEIIRGSTFTPDKVELTRGVLYREMGGKPSRVRRWLYTKGIGKSAFDRAVAALFPDERFFSDEIETGEGITREEIIQAFQKFYVPENMTLIVVGEFDPDRLLRKVRYTFGSLKKSSFKREKVVSPPYPSEPKEVSGTFSPILGSDGLVSLAFRTEGMLSKDYHALLFLSSYLEMRLYERLRVERGLSYSPSALYHSENRYGSFYLFADVNIKDMERSTLEMWAVLDELMGGNVDKGEFKRAKKGLLLSITQSYQTNGSRADYYAGTHAELEEFGELVDDEEAIEKLRASDMARVAKKYFRKDRVVTIGSRPTLTYTQLYMALIILIVIASGVVVYIAVRRRGRKKRRSRGLELPRSPFFRLK